MSTIDFSTDTPAGRAMEHILDTALAHRIGSGLDVKWRGGTARRLVIHPGFAHAETDTDDVDASLVLYVESLAGRRGVSLGHLYGLADDQQRQAIAIAGFIAAGYDVGAPATARQVAVS